MAEKKDESPKPSEYRGAKVTRYKKDGFFCYIDFPDTPLHGMATNRGRAQELIDWWVDTGGDQSKLPEGYKRIGKPDT